MADKLVGPPEFCATIEAIPEALKANAAQFLVYTDYFCDDGYVYYNTFVNDYWNPIIFQYIV